MSKPEIIDASKLDQRQRRRLLARVGAMLEFTHDLMPRAKAGWVTVTNGCVEYAIGDLHDPQLIVRVPIGGPNAE